MPKTVGKTESDIVLALAEKVGAEITSADIDVAHWVPTKDKNQANIIVKFLSCSARDKLLASSKKARLNASDLGLSGTTPIYVNEHLCPEYKQLLGKSVAAKKQHNWRYAWVSSGHNLMKKSDNSKTIRISTEADLAAQVA